MATSTIPQFRTRMSTDLVGKVVTIQTFEREDEETLKYDTRKQYVGTVEGYVQFGDILAISLGTGVGTVTIEGNDYYEVYVR